jgi:DNA-binding transcriptional ArsR family regulator
MGLDNSVSHDLQLVMAYAEVLTALADPTRRQILEALRAQPKSVGELAENQPVSRPAVSQHLKVLEAAGLVSVEPTGNRRLYSIRHEGLDDLRQYLDGFWSEVLLAYGEEIVQRMGNE